MKAEEKSNVREGEERRRRGRVRYSSGLSLRGRFLLPFLLFLLIFVLLLRSRSL